MTPEQLRAALVKGLGQAMRDTYGRRIDALEQRLKALEAGGAKSLIDAYRGTYKDGEQYQRGQLITHQGSLWFCGMDTNSRPGTGPHWTMAVKAGRDAR